MATLKFLTVHDKFLDYLLEKATPEEILAFEVSDEEKEYVQDLLERKSAGTITPEELVELNQIVEFDLLVTSLKASAVQTLKRSS